MNVHHGLRELGDCSLAGLAPLYAIENGFQVLEADGISTETLGEK
jgi:hypothetical protein